MSYTKQTWADGPGGGTPVSAARLQHIEDGIAATDNPVFGLSGTLVVKVGVGRYYVEQACTLASVRASVGTAPTGAAIIVDVSKNGTTVFTTQANRPTIPAGSTTSGLVTNMDVTALAAGDYLTVDVDQVGSTVAGADLVVQLRLSS